MATRATRSFAANSTGQGEALWDDVKVRAARATQPLNDVVLSVSYKSGSPRAPENSPRNW